MKIENVNDFLEYYSKVRARTRRVALLIPDTQLEWTYQPGKFTLGDLVRHIAAIERWLYAETVFGRPAAYQGCGPELASGKAAVLDYFDAMHAESVALFQQLTPEQLEAKVSTPAGYPITCWKWLRLLPEHEIHHRGQIYLYLNQLGVATPPLYGLSSEEVLELSQPKS
ncbi:MAG: DinB family protein [Lewinellaceae bacterium]|nr:DinB family protein [Saprospiraceae bacterium]MCB9330642.1 DinB family protein [Lewinellaceae bacterium]MCB9334473.1 DinB family protein [Lewinellaceae bacterium]